MLLCATRSVKSAKPASETCGMKSGENSILSEIMATEWGFKGR